MGDDSRAGDGRSVRRGLTILVVLYWCTLFVATHIPYPEGMIPPCVSDKVLHCVAYAGLAVLLAVWQTLERPLASSLAAKLLVLIAGYGAVDELLQMIPRLHRFAEFSDWLADMAGAILGLIAVFCVSWCWRRMMAKPPTQIQS